MAYPDTEPDSEHDPELDFEELGGQHNSDPTFDNVHNSSISDYALTSNKQ